MDLSEFLSNPIATGIQRIAGEMCKYFPPNSVAPVRIANGGFMALPSPLIEVIGNHFRNITRSGVEEIRRLCSAEKCAPITITHQDTILVPEVFNDSRRISLFRNLPEEHFARCRFIVYDLLPLTHPQYFPPGTSVGSYDYYRLLREANCCGFISEDTRIDYYARLKRTDLRGGVVLPLGGDSLGPRAKEVALHRPLTFSVLGTIEPRKNHELILDAFLPLLKRIKGLQLSFIGKMGWVDPEFARKVRALAEDESSGFRFHSVSGDDDIRTCIERSRATIYVSAAEGYGLPPVESLWLGTPVIASNTIPSLKALRPGGVHIVEPLDAENLRRAVLAFLDDGYANQKTEETLAVELPSWRLFTEEVLQWCGQSAA
jgi:glycosyltransferase involved in cell wall biosynthesis